MRRNQTSWVVIVGVLLVVVAGCDNSAGKKRADSQSSRDIDTQVDAAMKDFKNE